MSIIVLAGDSIHNKPQHNKIATPCVKSMLNVACTYKISGKLVKHIVPMIGKLSQHVNHTIVEHGRCWIVDKRTDQGFVGGESMIPTKAVGLATSNISPVLVAIGEFKAIRFGSQVLCCNVGIVRD